jgi:hypothetical protein
MTLAEKITRHEHGDWYGNYGLVPGPGHSAKDRSMSVRDSADGRGVVLHSFTGDDWRPLKDRWRAAGILTNLRSPSRTETTSPRPPRSKPPNDGNKQRPKQKHALQLWSESVEPGGTVVENYLASRGLLLPINASDVLRLHPRCPFGPGVHVPCMVALFRDVRSGEPVAIHRTALTKDGKKAFGQNSKMMLGPVTGAAIKLAPEVTGRIGIAEGVETALSVMQAGWSPVWAAGSAGGIEAIPTLPHAALTVFADPGERGQQAAYNLARTWISSGQSATIQTPQRGDFNDALLETAHG